MPGGALAYALAALGGGTHATCSANSLPAATELPMQYRMPQCSTERQHGSQPVRTHTHTNSAALVHQAPLNPLAIIGPMMRRVIGYLSRRLRWCPKQTRSPACCAAPAHTARHGSSAKRRCGQPHHYGVCASYACVHDAPSPHQPSAASPSRPWLAGEPPGPFDPSITHSSPRIPSIHHIHPSHPSIPSILVRGVVAGCMRGGGREAAAAASSGCRPCGGAPPWARPR